LRRNANQQNTFLKYTQHEQSLLQYLEKHERITIKELCKLLNISRWRAQKMLVNLISIGVIRSHTTEKTEFFTAS
jgi:predicted transcriptional regulator